MASLGRISNSLVAGVNENTLALASLNFDFSVIKVEAPSEYNALGLALSRPRREDAEDGPTHRISRKLGALFGDLIPSTPKLIAAYGNRCSEIMEAPSLNPPATNRKHGAFSAFVGADATSIWAAATSGGATIGVHLLACLLARSFSDPAKATSIWAELVADRQRDITTATQTPMLNALQIAAVNAANQQFPREDLRLWDASARAWLQTADACKRKEHIQLKLILENITLPISTGPSLYEAVIYAWRQAMIGLESLLNGEPQSVTNGAILLAISAWHLFPNLLVLGDRTTKVEFADPLIPSQGLLTLGITTKTECAKACSGIYWSVALSHYRYYGRPTKEMTGMDDRFNMQELHVVALGSLLRTWNVPREQLEVSARWFVSLWSCICSASLPPPKWLKVLALAADDFLSAKDNHKKDLARLMDFGYRRGRNFLIKSSRHSRSLPWFGLRSRHIFESLQSEDEMMCAVTYLRHMAVAGGLEPHQVLITHVSNGMSGMVKKEVHEYHTAIKRHNPADDITSNPPEIHAVPGLEEDQLDESPNNPKEVDELSPSKENIRGKDTANVKNSASSKHSGPTYWDHRRWEGTFVQRKENYGGQACPHISPSHNLALHQREIGLIRQPLTCFNLSKNQDTTVKDCDAILQDGLGWFPGPVVHFTKAIDDSLGVIRLWITKFADGGQEKLEEAVRHLRSGVGGESIAINESIAAFDAREDSNPNKLNPLLVWQYLEGPTLYESRYSMKPALDLMKVERQQAEPMIDSLKKLSIAYEIYEALDGATVSSTIVETGIHTAKWYVKGGIYPTTKSMAFSCIAMMETGKVNLEPDSLEEVFALSSGNSIFVSSCLLSDPYMEPRQAITRIVGNVGRPGISLLVPPTAPALVRSLSSSYKAVSYKPFDGGREDNFQGTSLHLSFTSHVFPVDYGVTGIIDHQVFLVESVISVHDAGQWVADLNIDRAFRENAHDRLPRTSKQGTCRHKEDAKQAALTKFTSVDTWEEILDTPPSIGIIRAHKNWPARLAASIVPSNERSETEPYSDDDNEFEESSRDIGSRRAIVLGNDSVGCWVCVYKAVQRLIAGQEISSLYLII